MKQSRPSLNGVRPIWEVLPEIGGGKPAHLQGRVQVMPLVLPEVMIVESLNAQGEVTNTWGEIQNYPDYSR